MERYKSKTTSRTYTANDGSYIDEESGIPRFPCTFQNGELEVYAGPTPQDIARAIRQFQTELRGNAAKIAAIIE